MTRFLHTADWQIGRQYGRFESEDAAVLADARIEAIKTLANLAQEHQVTAVLVAGDVFDVQTISDRTLHRTLQATAGFAGPWLMLPGNHDAALATGVWTRVRAAAPDHIHVLDTPEPRVFQAQGFAVLPAPLTQRQTHADLTEWFDRAETPRGLLRIGLAHGSITGPLAELVDAHNPIAADRAERARLDYLALGDWHGTKEINARTWYSGTPEPDRFRDNNAGNALLVEIDSPGATPRVLIHSTARHLWHRLEAVVMVDSDIDALRTQLDALTDDSVVDLALTGQLSLERHRQLTGLLQEVGARHRSFQADLGGLHLLPTEADLADLEADGYVNAVIETLRDQQQGDLPADADAARDALVILAGWLAERTNTGSAQ